MRRSSFNNDDSDIFTKYKIIILGMSTSGKTKLLTRYEHGFYEDSGVTTLTVDMNIIKRNQIIYAYYDTAGQEKYRSLVDHYYRGADACIIVYDVTSYRSFEEISFYYNKIKQLSEDSLIYIVGCKNDLKCSVTPQDIERKYKGIKNFVTSAKLNENVTETFHQIQDDLIKLKPKIFEKTPIRQTFSRLSHKTQKKELNSKNGCCKSQ